MGWAVPLSLTRAARARSAPVYGSSGKSCSRIVDRGWKIEDRRSWIEDRRSPRSSILDLPSSILDSSIPRLVPKIMRRLITLFVFVVALFALGAPPSVEQVKAQVARVEVERAMRKAADAPSDNLRYILGEQI